MADAAAEQPPRRLWATARGWETALDVALALTVIVEGARGIAGTANIAELALAVAGVGTAAVRRRSPRVMMAVLIALSGLGALASPTSMIGLWVTAQVGLFSLALRRNVRVSAGAAALLAVVMYAVVAGLYRTPVLDPSALVVLVWTAAVAGAALTIRAQHEAVLAEVERADSIEDAHASVVSRLLTEERLRIARDLHDSVAHGISLIALQTGAVEAALSNPAQAQSALRDVRATARAVLGETQQVLHLLRDDSPFRSDTNGGGAPELTPEAVLEEGRTGGTVINVTAWADTALWSGAIRVSIARVLREALTNARRHGRGPVTITLVTSDDDVKMTVMNLVATWHAAASGSTQARPGFGLRGIKERTSALGGETRVHRADGVFALTVRIPRRPHAGSTS